MKRYTTEELIEACSPFSDTPVPVGVAIGPHAHSLLLRTNRSQDIPYNHFETGIPMLVDPRLSLDQNEVYYDLSSWKDRVAEQQAWDAEGGLPG